MEKTAITQAIEKIQVLQKEANEAKSMPENKSKLNQEFLQGLWVGYLAVIELLEDQGIEAERQQIIEAYEDPTCQTFTGEQYYNQKYKE